MGVRCDGTHTWDDRGPRNVGLLSGVQMDVGGQPFVSQVAETSTNKGERIWLSGVEDYSHYALVISTIIVGIKYLLSVLHTSLCVSNLRFQVL